MHKHTVRRPLAALASAAVAAAALAGALATPSLASAPASAVVVEGVGLNLAYAQARAQMENLPVCSSDSSPADSPAPIPVSSSSAAPASEPDAIPAVVDSSAAPTEPTATEPTGSAAAPTASTAPDVSSDPTATQAPASADPSPAPSDSAVDCIPVEAVDATSVTALTSSGSLSASRRPQLVDYASLVQAQAKQSFETPAGSLTASADQILSNDEGASARVVTVERTSTGRLTVATTAELAKDQAAAVIERAQDDPSTVAVSVAQTVSIQDRVTRPTSSPYSYTATSSTDDQRAYQRFNYDLGDPMAVFYRTGSAAQIEYPWKLSRGAGVTVAVVDTGVDGTHPDLSGQVLPGYDFVSGATGAQAGWNDQNSHGTHVAGIIAAKDNNAIGITGIAPDAKILPVRVMGADGSGTSANVARGIIAATDAGAQVINLSLGSPTPDAALEAAVAYAVSHGVSVVAAGGNIGMPGYLTTDGWNYPASYPGVIGVGSVNPDCGGVGGDHIDISAPGCAILSTVPGGSYARYSGTSMATPQVAAEAALFRALGKSMAATESLIEGSTALELYIMAFDCVEAPDSTPTNRHQICTPAGINETDTMKLFGHGAIQIPDAMRAAASVSYTSGDYWGAASATPASPSPAAGGGSSAPAPSAGGGSSSGGGSSAPAPSAGGGSSSGGGGGGALQEIREVRPASGPLAGGNTIAIVGYGLKDVTKVTVGGKTASFTVVNDAHVDVVVPAGDKAGSVDVALVISPERGRAFAGGGYTYQDTPAASAAPSVPADASGPTVTIPEQPLTPVAASRPTVQFTAGRLLVSLPSGASKAAVQQRKAGKWRTVRTLSAAATSMSLSAKAGTYRVLATVSGKPVLSRTVTVPR